VKARVSGFRFQVSSRHPRPRAAPLRRSAPASGHQPKSRTRDPSSLGLPCWILDIPRVGTVFSRKGTQRSQRPDSEFCVPCVLWRPKVFRGSRAQRNRRCRRCAQMLRRGPRGARTLLSAFSGVQTLEPRIARRSRRGQGRAPLRRRRGFPGWRTLSRFRWAAEGRRGGGFLTPRRQGAKARRRRVSLQASASWHLRVSLSTP
jgi:hypothetical protein